jgi:ATP-dependent exoDNAse (exonuclease V) alpha subunit
MKACSQIRDGKDFQTDEYLDIDADDPKNLLMIPARKEAAVQEVMDLVTGLRENGRFDAIWDVQIIIAINKKSYASRVDLNKRLQLELNPFGQGIQGSPFLTGDKVIMLKNSPFACEDDRSNFPHRLVRQVSERLRS